MLQPGPSWFETFLVWSLPGLEPSWFGAFTANRKRESGKEGRREGGKEGKEGRKEGRREGRKQKKDPRLKGH